MVTSLSSPRDTAHHAQMDTRIFVHEKHPLYRWKAWKYGHFLCCSGFVLRARFLLCRPVQYIFIAPKWNLAPRCACAALMNCHLSSRCSWKVSFLIYMRIYQCNYLPSLPHLLLPHHKQWAKIMRTDNGSRFHLCYRFNCLGCVFYPPLRQIHLSQDFFLLHCA